MCYWENWSRQVLSLRAYPPGAPNLCPVTSKTDGFGGSPDGCPVKCPHWHPPNKPDVLFLSEADMWGCGEICVQFACPAPPRGGVGHKLGWTGTLGGAGVAVFRVRHPNGPWGGCFRGPGGDALMFFPFNIIWKLRTFDIWLWCTMNHPGKKSNTLASVMFLYTFLKFV